MQTQSSPSPRRSEPLSERFDRLEGMTAQAGWDEPRSRPIPAEAWSRARTLVQAVSAEVPAAVRVFVSPCTDGSIHLRWSTSDRRLDIELADDGVFFTEWAAGAVLAEGETSLRDVIGRVRILFR
jgi:hypothetical protein